ncbi:MAG: Qat anti-phage system associated protein QatB [Algoriphagus aquaeductus]|uniref:Qat anti-phage system associated protein QatB n=1 Tax=Algoriphagus aquaeductus TaxID=475299 RepID=UPI00391954E6
MGTSNSFGGPGNQTPLIPSFLGGGDGDIGGQNNSDNNNAGERDNGNNDSGQEGTPDRNTSQRFRAARTNFTKFVNSGGRDRRALGRSISSYVSRSAGGSGNASKRIGASKRVTAGIFGFLNSVRTDGVATALSSRNLNNLIGKPIDEVFVGLLEDMCPDGGNIDEGLARNAFVETIAQLVNEGLETLDNLSAEQFQHVIEVFVTNAIEGRLYNDIGSKVIFESSDVRTVEFIQEQVHDFIQGSVADAIARHSAEFDNISGLDTNTLVDEIYTDAYEILESLSENEAND